MADIIDGKIHIAGAGVTSITASQNGDVNFNPAVDVVQTFTVAKKELTVTAENAEKIYGEENPSFNYSLKGL